MNAPVLLPERQMSAMEKILVGLFIPAVKLHMDLFVPQNSRIGVLTEILARGVADLSDGRYCVSGYELLSTREPDALLDPALTLADYGIQDGAQLILM